MLHTTDCFLQPRRTIEAIPAIIAAIREPSAVAFRIATVIAAIKATIIPIATFVNIGTIIAIVVATPAAVSIH